jgi:predicted HTH transcriptional regulator
LLIFRFAFYFSVVFYLAGMSRILKPYDRKIFEISPSFTIVTFPFEEAFITPNGKINGEIKSTLEVIKQTPTATIAQIAELTGKSQRTISRELREYQAAGLLGREGSKKSGSWVVL